MNILSLCDGMSCGMIALGRAGIKVDKYYASEIKEIAIKVSRYNYPNIIQIGNVNNVSYSNGILHTDVGDFKDDIDMVIFGSPCQTFSIAIPTEKRVGRENKDKSGLFDECYRVLKEVNPKYFLMENVRSMKDEDRDYISNLLEVKPIMIDSAFVAPALRKRYYWTNIPNVTQPSKVDIHLQDILNEGYTDREKARCLAVIDSRPNTTPIKMFHRYYSTGFTTLIFKSKEYYDKCVKEYKTLTNGKRKVHAKELDAYKDNVFDGVRYMNQEELEKCQCVPAGYTKCLTRNESADVLGDGWTIDVISHILSFLPDTYKK